MSATDLFSIEGKTAVVTGGSRGIGLMIARGFVSAGARVYISSRKADACEAAAEELRGFGECTAIPADLGGLAGCEHLAREVADREGALHILVNNAGATWGAPLEEYPDSAWERVIGVNLKGPFHLTKLFLPLLRKGARDGDPARVVNIGSVDGMHVPRWENYAYSASKAAVHQLTRHLASTLARDGITVNAIAPGLFPSKMTEFMFRAPSDEPFRAIPLGRAGAPEDAAGTAIFLCSRAGAYVTGAILVVDGGISL